MKRKKNKKGFSMIEVLLSVFILSSGLVVIVTLLTKSLKDSADSRNIIIASQLAQEGVELVRNFRDNNIAFALSDPFLGLDTADNLHHCPRVGVSVNTSPVGSVMLCPNTSYKLYFKDGVGYTYESAGAKDTVFSRKVDNLGGDPKKIRSIVIWRRTDFSPFIANINNCTLANQCVYIDQNLNSVGWN